MSSWLKSLNIVSKLTSSPTKVSPKQAIVKILDSNIQTQNIKMTTHAILNNGIKIPRIGLGTYGVKDKLLCHSLFSDAIKVGYRLFDTGTLYGNDEFIGDVIYEKLASQEFKREDFHVITKIAPYQHGKEQTDAAISGSLKRLKLSYLDTVLIHWPGVAKVPPTDSKNKALRKETWQTLENFVKTGKIKSIGVSNYNEAHLSDLLEYCKIKPVLNQVEFHPMCYQESLLNFCKSNSIHLQAYSSLGSSQSKPPGWQVLFGNEIVKSVAKKHNKSIPQILLRWGYQHDCLLIPKTSRSENLKPNLEIEDFVLDEEDMKNLNGLNQGKHFCWNPSNIV